MEPATRLLGIELLVPDLSRAVELFVGVLGWEVATRAQSPVTGTELAIVTDGAMAITLLVTTDDPLVDTTRAGRPRLSQIVVAGDPAAALAAAIEAGLATAEISGGSFVTPESVEGALGQPVAIVVTGGGDVDVAAGLPDAG